MRNILLLFVSIGVLIVPLVGSEKREFISDVEQLILEPWRWHRLEALDEFEILCGVEHDSGDLWLGSMEGLIQFDGINVELSPFPESLDGFEPYSIHVTSSEYAYIVGSQGLLVWHQNEWEILLEFDCFFPGGKYLFAESKDGLLIAGTPQGLYRLNETNCIKVGERSVYPSGLAVSGRNELFVAPSGGNFVFRIPFDLQHLSDPLFWIPERVTHQNVSGMVFFNTGPENDVVVIDYFKNNSAHRYSYDQKKWVEYGADLGQGGYSHGSGIKLQDSCSIIFSKTRIQLVKAEHSMTLTNENFDIPNSAPFGIVRKNGNLIVGGRGEPIREIDLSHERWLTLNNLLFQCEDLDGRFWFINFEGDIVTCGKDLKGWKKLPARPITTPTSITLASNGGIWVAGSHNGVAAVAFLQNGRWNRELIPELVSSVSHLSAVELANGDMCFGSGHEVDVNVGGIVCFKRTEHGYEKQIYESPIVPNRPVGIVQDQENVLWFGGLRLTKTSESLDEPYEVDDRLNVEWIDHMASDEDGNFFIGTWLKGLFRRDGDGWSRVEGNGEIASERVAFVHIDQVRPGNLWVATDSGVSRLIDGNWITRAMPSLLKMAREGGTIAQSRDGSIWVNRSSRDWYFRNSLEVPIRDTITNFGCIRFRPEEERPIVELEKFEEGGTEPANVVFRWSGMDVGSRTKTEDLSYSYRINGGKWSEFSRTNETILTDLKGGQHVFEVMVRDLDGNYSAAPASLYFEIRPPLWKRAWFIAAIVLVVAVIVILGFTLIRQRVNHILQLEEFKLQFFTNLSHELRTPLTVIIGPLESALKKLPAEVDKKPFELAYRNSKKMLHLVDQILEFRRIEIGNIENHYTTGNIIGEIEETVGLLRPLAEQKAISLICSHNQTEFISKYDSEKLERILTNLISNAIKYSHDNSSVTVLTRIVGHNNSKSLVLIVEDRGIGIDPDKMRTIFEPFHRLQRPGELRKTRGVGLGLSLVKSLLDAMGGEIDVESPAAVVDGENVGARFRIQIPLIEEEIDMLKASQPDNSDAILNLEHDGETDAAPLQSGSQQSLEQDAPAILIVDDEEDIVSFLEYELNDIAKIFTAFDGLEAFKTAKKIVPDLVITDIVMPKMDGNQLISKLKSSEQTRHIPIIALTAQRSELNQLKTLVKGADDFLHKPISIDILKQKAQNYIESRKALLDELKDRSESGESSKGDDDKKLVVQCKDIIAENLSDPSFDIEILASEMGMSRMTLYRKLMAILETSPGDLLKEMRMNEAANLLRKTKMSVSDVADSVGYQEVSNFSSAFKKYFKMTPSVYRRGKGNESGSG